MASPRAGARARRSWPRRLLIVANVFVALCILLTGSVYAYFRIQYGRLDQISLGDWLRPEEPPGEPMNVLLVGSDTRGVIEGEEKKSFGNAREVGGQRADTIIILRVDPETKAAAMLSIPRDTYVPIAGTTEMDKINDAFQTGPGRLIQTITQNFGIPIDHYVQVDFNGFRGIVNALGGVEMYVPSPVRDKLSGLRIPDPGCYTLDGELSLAWVRSRHFEVYESGRWRPDPSSDIGRIQRQQDFIRRVMKKAVHKTRKLDLRAMNGMINAAIKNVTTDESLDPRDILKLAEQFRSLEPGAVEMMTIPTYPDRAGAASVLRLKEEEAQAVVDTFLAIGTDPPPGEEAPPDISPSEIRVRVLNGSGVGGQASSAKAALQEAGYNVADVGDAATFRYSASEIRFGPGQRDAALLLRSHVQGRTRLVRDATLVGVDVVLTTGSQYEGIEAPDGAAPPPTAPPATTAEEPASDPEEEAC